MAPNISERVAVLETQMLEVKSDVAQIRADTRKLIWLLLGAIILAGANFALKGGFADVAASLPKAAAIELGAPATMPGRYRETLG